MEASSPSARSACPRCGTLIAAGAVACFKCGFAIEVKEKTGYTEGIRPPTQVSQSDANLLDNKWLLVEKIGAGGMGTVWLAKDTVLGRKVAVKVLSESLSLLPEYIERFEREAQVMASLDHPNIVTLFAVGRKGSQPYMVMKFLEGAPLNKYLNPRLTPQQALPLFRQMCDGLSVMHERKVLHRDLKPANLFVSPTGHLTILDLGIARQVGSSLTKTGIMFGTPAYMSPEQIAGDKTLDQRTDIYSAGAVLFEMITGRTPFQSDEEHSLLLMHIQAPPPDASTLMPDIPRPLGIALQRALSKRPADRFGTITELYDAVATALGHAPLPKLAASPAAGTGRSTRELAPDVEEVKPTEPGAPTPFPAKAPPRRVSSPSNQKVRSRSSEKVPQLARAAPIADEGPEPSTVQASPDAATPKGAPAPIELLSTRPRTAVKLPASKDEEKAPTPLGIRVITIAVVTVFVLLAGYFMARVIAATPKDPEPPPPAKGQVMLKPADDTPKQVVTPPVDVSKELANDLRHLDAEDAKNIDPGKVGAGGSVLEQAEKDAAEGKTTQKSGAPPPANQLRMPKAGELRITTTYIGRPISASVWLGKTFAGKTPLYLHTKNGVYDIKVTFPNVPDVQLSIIVNTAKGQDLPMELGGLPLEMQPYWKDGDVAKREAAKTAAKREEDQEPQPSAE